MAKSARASSRKNNNQKLKKNVFGPVESARTERLSAKLMELVAQQIPAKEDKADENAMEDGMLKYSYAGGKREVQRTDANVCDRQRGAHTQRSAQGGGLYVFLSSHNMT